MSHVAITVSRPGNTFEARLVTQIRKSPYHRASDGRRRGLYKPFSHHLPLCAWRNLRTTRDLYGATRMLHCIVFLCSCVNFSLLSKMSIIEDNEEPLHLTWQRNSLCLFGLLCHVPRGVTTSCDCDSRVYLSVKWPHAARSLPTIRVNYGWAA